MIKVFNNFSTKPAVFPEPLIFIYFRRFKNLEIYGSGICLGASKKV